MKELPHKAAQLRLSVARRVYRLSGGSSFNVAWYLGRRSERDQRRRNSGAERDQNTLGPTSAALSHGRDQQLALRRPRLVWINGLITVTIMAVMIAGTVDPAVMS
jgi:CitMHS family citrate-Mg2+:H+ or citrate-Ca2+:H+ symporter